METKDNQHITHHTVQDRTVFENLHRSRSSMWQRMRTGLAENPISLSSISADATELSIDAVLEGRPSDALDLLRFAHLARLWHWHGMTDDGPHLVRLPGIADFEAGRMRPNVDVHVPSVVEGMEIAIILRDYPPDCIYRQVNFDAISNFGGVQMDSWSGHELRAMQQVGLRNEMAIESFQLAESAMKDLIARDEGYSGLEPLFVPLFHAWVALLGTRDAEEFNHQIQTHLLNWKADYNSTKDGSSVVNGFLSFRALAACAYAHDLGMKVTVTSDYIPDFLIRGDFPRVRWPNPEWITG